MIRTILLVFKYRDFHNDNKIFKIFTPLNYVSTIFHRVLIRHFVRRSNFTQTAEMVRCLAVCPTYDAIPFCVTNNAHTIWTKKWCALNIHNFAPLSLQATLPELSASVMHAADQPTSY
ncbi:hypothetical protein ACW910_22460 (plasmid) [Burkholderia ambifaria]